MEEKHQLFQVVTDLILYLAEADANMINDDDMIAQVESAVEALSKLPVETADEYRSFLKVYKNTSTNQFAEGVDHLLEALED